MSDCELRIANFELRHHQIANVGLRISNWGEFRNSKFAILAYLLALAVFPIRVKMARSSPDS